MNYYVGFDFFEAEKYKRIDTAKKAAQQKKMAVFNEEKAIIEDYRENKKIVEIIDGTPAERIDGYVKQTFDGVIRLRKRPSWEADAVCGAEKIERKEVKYVLEVDGRKMYRTLDGFYITGDENVVEFVKE